LIGSDGLKYTFLLKGGEDLRQDQRVVQFFALMNSLMPSSAPHITIIGVLPLSTTAGLIQWIKGCDTRGSLIREKRERDGARDIDLEILERLTVKGDGVHKLLPIRRCEALEAVFNETRGDELQEILWLKAPDAESWVRQIFNFSKTSAVMSIVGYIIGLGDRHPDNLMIQRLSGKVVHIDFGDCFEVTQKRVTLQERIPFRLTRMMVKAFGPCGVNGSFRAVSELTVRTVRADREAIMAILEIFIREPVSTGHGIEAQPPAVMSGSLALKDLIASGGSLDAVGTDRKQVMKRMIEKIDGLDFATERPLSSEEQVDRLIAAARDTYNLSYLYVLWRPTW
jgi:FKBP12-rapamycin complex-associated protein